MKKLTALSLAGRKTVGLHRNPDCVGLYIQVTQKQEGIFARSWIYRYRSPIIKNKSGKRGQHRYMGLGSCDCISIAKAR
jgi:hypothetical protein